MNFDSANMRPKFLSAEGCCYLVVAKAQRGQKIFTQVAGYRYFLRLVKKYKNVHAVHVFAFCLLPQEVHLIVHAPDIRVCGSFLRDVNAAYQSFWRCFSPRASAGLWRVQKSLISDDQQLFRGIDTLEALPVSLGLVPAAANYCWSSSSFRVFRETDAILDTRIKIRDVLPRGEKIKRTLFPQGQLAARTVKTSLLF